jgi:hypothetical protein
MIYIILIQNMYNVAITLKYTGIKYRETCRSGLMLCVCMCASCWFYKMKYVTLHGMKNVKIITIRFSVLLANNHLT